MDEVADRLYVGTGDDAGDAALLREAGVDRVVSLTHADPDVPAGVACGRVPMLDGPRNDPEAFGRAVEATLAGLDAGERVLVHCSAGSSRSVAVAAAAIALRREWPVDRAFDAVAARRPEADPHDALRERAADAVARR